MPDAAFVSCFRRAGKPPFINTAALRAIGVQILRMQLDPAARMEKAPRHPGWGQSQQPLSLVESPVENLGDVIRLDDLRFVHGGPQKVQFSAAASIPPAAANRPERW